LDFAGLTLKTTSNDAVGITACERRNCVSAPEEGDAHELERGHEEVGGELGDVAERDGGLRLVEVQRMTADYRQEEGQEAEALEAGKQYRAHRYPSCLHVRLARRVHTSSSSDTHDQHRRALETLGGEPVDGVQWSSGGHCRELV